MTSAIVLAGGRATRLAGVVDDRPKALADIAGRPFLDWQFDYLAGQGVERVVLALGHLAQPVIDRYRGRYGALRIDHVIEPAPLGTGGAIRFAFAEAGLDAAYVLNGDSLAPFALALLDGDDEFSLAIREVDDASRYGSVRCEGDRIVAFGEKAAAGRGWINAGVYRIRRRALDRWPLPPSFSLERDLLAAHAAEMRPRAVRVSAPFIDIGTPESLRDAAQVIPAMFAAGIPRER